jgi:hypothetical protein
VERPKIELAEIIRWYGDAYRAEHETSLSGTQRRVMQAIAACRTAALGGHVEGCDACGHQRISYNSCLMGSPPLWWGPIPLVVLGGLPPVYNSPLRLGFQQRHQSVRRPELTFAKVWRHDCVNGLELLARVGANIDLRGREVAVSQP